MFLPPQLVRERFPALVVTRVLFATLERGANERKAVQAQQGIWCGHPFPKMLPAAPLQTHHPFNRSILDAQPVLATGRPLLELEVAKQQAVNSLAFVAQKIMGNKKKKLFQH